MSKGHSDRHGTTTSESVAKKMFRQIWEYGQKVESGSRAARHTTDLFQSELEALRKRLREKCMKLLLLRSSYSRKAEELLWKRGFYDIIQRCKQRGDALDGASPLWQQYSQHLSHALRFYCHLVHKMEIHFGVESSQLSELNAPTLPGSKADLDWLREVLYKSFIHLGDLARYQVGLGGDVAAAMAFYHKAITLDPNNGSAFNQLAVLVGSKNNHLDSIYYYQRSIVSAQPFSGSEANMLSLFDKSHKALEQLESRFMRSTDPDTREMTKQLLFLRFIEIQRALYSGNKSPVSPSNSLSKLCEDTLESLKQCLDANLEALREGLDERVGHVLSGKSHSAGEGDVVLQPDVLIKLTALAILPSYSLRQLGSTFTPVATAFALSVFSQLLSYSFQCITELVLSTIRIKHSTFDAPAASAMPGKADIIDSLEHGKSIVSLFMEYEVPAIVLREESGTKSSAKKTPPPTPSGSTSAVGHTPSKQKKRRVVDRRRRKRGGVSERNSSGEEESEDDSDSLSSDGSLEKLSSDDEDLSLDNLGEDDLDLLDSLSESSSSEEDEEGEKEERRNVAEDVSSRKNLSTLSDVTPAPVSSKRAGRKHIVLAANFSMPPKNPHSPAQQKSDADSNACSNVTPTPSQQQQTDSQLAELVEDTTFQSAVYAVCKLLAEEKCLMALKVFTYWLHSYPIIIATCTQSSATMWSRIASLLNVIPTRVELVSSNVAGSAVKEGKCSLLEDHILRGFPPIAPALQALHFRASESDPLSPIQEISLRLHALQSFGDFLAEAVTAPSFTYDHSAEGKFEGPAQKAMKEQEAAKAMEEEDRKQAEVKRSKLMKAMAHQRLKTEVNTLAEATSRTEEVIFTPYLIPDASSLCSGLHLVRKLLKTEKFVFVIAKAVIEVLDGMKRGRESYAAREAIKFLEKELHGGNKFIQAQKLSESLHPGKKKPGKMDVQDWHFECLVDCACYFNHTFAQKGQSQAVATLLVEKSVLDILTNPSKQHAENSHVAEMLVAAQQNGVDLDTLVGFHINWSKNSKKKTVSV